MDGFAALFFGVYGLFIGSCIIILIYLVFRRIRIKKTENFENRDN